LNFILIVLENCKFVMKFLSNFCFLRVYGKLGPRGGRRLDKTLIDGKNLWILIPICTTYIYHFKLEAPNTFGVS
jgi:hypothetical protein